MSLPDIISIDPLLSLPRARVVVPGSKSITNRALILAALGQGEMRLNGALWSEDTQVMVSCLQRLGFSIDVLDDPNEPGNRSLVVEGQSGFVPSGGTEDSPLELFVGNAGTAARFLMAFLCLGSGCYRLHGVDRMHERPQSGLIKALRQLGYRIETNTDRLPVTIFGAGPRDRSCSVDISESSQFASALLLSAGVGDWIVKFSGKRLAELPYVNMTLELVEAMNVAKGVFQIEPDASSGSYFWAVNALGLGQSAIQHPESSDRQLSVTVDNWPETGWQIDASFPQFLSTIAPVSRDSDLGDSIMTSIVLAAMGNEARLFRDLGRLRVQECERVLALRTELTKCGIQVVETGDDLIVHPGSLTPATIETYEDHRLAMCFAVLGLKAGGIRLKDPSCVKKTFPTFFQKLAAKPPFGLGATIRDALSNERLSGEGLFAS
jgi:3-phosphoshikimate 1-carboxyvinyltransferase